MTPAGPRSRLWSAAAALILCAHALLGVWAARTHSATYDEPALIGAGLSYWRTGDLRLAPNDPPLALLWLTLPGALLRPRLPLDGREWAGGYMYAFGERALYWSGNDADAVVFSARAMTLLLSLAFGAALFAWTRRRWGGGPASFALALYAFSPSVLAHASLATLDLPAAAAAALAALALAEFLDDPSPRRALFFSAAAFVAFLCKYSAIVVWPAAALALAASPEPARRARALALWGLLPWLAAAAALSLAVPKLPEGLLARLGQASAGAHPSYLMGARSDGGWRAYYLVAALVKSTVPELAAAAALAWLLASRRRRAGPAVVAPLALAAAYLTAASLSHKQTGLRYALAAYPALAAAAASAARRLWERPRGPALLLGIAAWQAACALGSGPQWLAYFNEAAGGPARGSYWLADSNLDWGQDLRRLAAWVHAQGDPPLILSYFGTASPDYYGLRAQCARCTNAVQRRWILPPSPPRELFAISRTHLQEVYWPAPAVPPALREAEPVARVGASILVFDASRSPGLHRWLSDVYAADGDGALAARERERAAALSRAP